MLKHSIYLVSMVTVLALAACGKKGSSGNASNATPPAIADGAVSFNGDPYQALNQDLGRWEEVDGERYFVPDLSLVENADDWEPYQDGSWTYDEDEDRGMTWVSNEPWGWMTEHYGVWRNHVQLGWIWLPFNSRLESSHYQPHCVTWFDDGDYIGWYPYYEPYKNRYRRSSHFRDNYWDGPQAIASLNISSGGFGLHFGVTVINRSDIGYRNIRLKRQARSLGYSVAHRAHRYHHSRIGRVPGGIRNNHFEFVNRFAREKVGRTRSKDIRSRGGVIIRQPVRTHKSPPGFAQRLNKKRQAMPGRENMNRWREEGRGLDRGFPGQRGDGRDVKREERERNRGNERDDRRQRGDVGHDNDRHQRDGARHDNDRRQRDDGAQQDNDRRQRDGARQDGDRRQGDRRKDNGMQPQVLPPVTTPPKTPAPKIEEPKVKERGERNRGEERKERRPREERPVREEKSDIKKVEAPVVAPVEAPVVAPVVRTPPPQIQEPVVQPNIVEKDRSEENEKRGNREGRGEQRGERKRDNSGDDKAAMDQVTGEEGDKPAKTKRVGRFNFRQDGPGTNQ